MSDTIMPAFIRHPRVGRLVGGLLSSYGELEIGLCMCVVEVRDDLDAVFKSMFRPRGETQRIDIADALGRQLYRDIRLGTPFEEAIGAVRYCLKLRNQYAHCYWSDDIVAKTISFVDFEETAKSNDKLSDFTDLPHRAVDEGILENQNRFFIWTENQIRYTTAQARVALGKSSKNPFQAPRKGLRPPLYKPS